MQDVRRPASSSMFLRHFSQRQLCEVKLSFNRTKIPRTEIRDYERGRIGNRKWRNAWNLRALKYLLKNTMVRF